jgi:hypothetical protein
MKKADVEGQASVPHPPLGNDSDRENNSPNDE